MVTFICESVALNMPANLENSAVGHRTGKVQFSFQMNCLRVSCNVTCFPGGSDSEESASNAGGLGSVPGSRRSPGDGNGNPLQYSCLENSMNRGA